MNREEVLTLLMEKRFTDLVQKFREGRLYSELSNDTIFHQIFWDNFFPELLNTTNPVEDRGFILTMLHGYHKDKKHPFFFPISETDKVGYILLEEYPLESIAKDFSHLDLAKEIIQKHNERTKNQIEENRTRGKLKQEFSLKEINESRDKKDEYVIDIFKSPQERELFDELELSLRDQFIILPNTALSTIISNGILKDTPKREQSFFHNTTVDISIIDRKIGKAVLVIELDSSYHDDPNQQIKDRMKDRIFESTCIKFVRLRRKDWRKDPNYKAIIDFVSRELKRG